MTFEEDFPSLKDKISLQYEYNDKSFAIETTTKVIQERCLDKEKVRKILIALEEEWWLTIGEDDNTKASHITKILFEELGL